MPILFSNRPRLSEIFYLLKLYQKCVIKLKYLHGEVGSAKIAVSCHHGQRLESLSLRFMFRDLLAGKQGKES